MGDNVYSFPGKEIPEHWQHFYREGAPLTDAFLNQIEGVFNAVEMPSMPVLVAGLARGKFPEIPGVDDLKRSALTLVRTIEVKTSVNAGEIKEIREEVAMLCKKIDVLSNVVHKIQHSIAQDSKGGDDE